LVKEKLINLFAEKIAKMEGFYNPSTISFRNNNPGNLRSWGTVPIFDGYARFSTPEGGWIALREQIRKNVFVRKLTFYEFFAGKKGVYAGYAPTDDGNLPAVYASYVAKAFEVPKETVIADLVDKV